jgi:acetylornithine deacetylase/succinyl-diaminopimelate desuccinylase family protein
MINKNRLIKLTQDLIRINSENPPGNERAIALFVRKYLLHLGLKTRIVEFKKNRSNLLAYLKGKKRRSLIVTPHLDTVPAGKSWKADPFAAKIVAGRIYGLGATDCKGNLSAGIEAINSIVEDGIKLDYDLIFAATADEESGSEEGLKKLLDKKILKGSAALVLDADGFEVIVAQKGLLHLTVKIKGKRAHGAYPWLGVNAIDLAVSVLHDLKKYRFRVTENKHLKPPTMNIGVIKGGDKVNVVADWCEFELDFRYLSGTGADEILRDIRRIIARHTRDFKIEVQGIQKPYLIKEDHSLVSRMAAALKGCGVKPRIRGSEGATVISFFQARSIPAIATGYGVEECAHIADEFVRIGELCKGAGVIEKFLKQY